MSERDQQASGDYGYDLAHEETGRGRAREDTTGHEHGSAPPAGDGNDSVGDLSYDQAHDF